MSGPLAKKNPLSGLMSPWMVLASLLAGTWIGTHDQELAAKLAPMGDIYLALLEMCVLPILVTAIVSGLGRLLATRSPMINPNRLLAGFVGGLMLASAVGLTAGLLIKPGDGLDRDDRATLGQQLKKMESDGVDFEEEPRPDFSQVVMAMVPRNIVAAISKGPSLAVLFVSVLLGCALGLQRTPGAEAALTMMEGIYGAFLKIIFWLLYGLPLGILGLFSGQIAKTGPEILLVMFDLLLACAAAAAFLMVMYALVIWRVLRQPFWATVGVFRQTFVIALTASAFATIPSTLQALHKGLGVPKNVADLLFPLGINLNRHGSVFQFALAAVFMSQIYDTSLDPATLAIIWVGAILAGMAALGGLPGLAMLAIVMQLLGLPSQVAAILLTSVDLFMIPMLVLVSVYANCALTVLACRKPGSAAE